MLRHLAQMSKCRLNIAQGRSLGLVGCNVLCRHKQRTHFSEIIKSTMSALWKIDPILAPEQPVDKTVDLLHSHSRPPTPSDGGTRMVIEHHLAQRLLIRFEIGDFAFFDLPPTLSMKAIDLSYSGYLSFADTGIALS